MTPRPMKKIVAELEDTVAKLAAEFYSSSEGLLRVDSVVVGMSPGGEYVQAKVVLQQTKGYTAWDANVEPYIEQTV